MAEKLGDLLLTPAEMAAVDAATAESGIASFGLMWSAGAAVAGAALRLYPGALRFAVLCGPGNNGGDGYVAARRLAESGAEVAVFHLGDPARLHGDAARARAECALASQPLAVYIPGPGDVVVDAIFGAGLGRDVPQQVRSVIEQGTGAAVPVISVDFPSGRGGRSGRGPGAAFKAAPTGPVLTRQPRPLPMPGGG
ncbi:NAD(P)H-hydrate epimerase, partial [Rhizobium sp. SEMIA 4085]|uniref:NAD(P)H-hydrate epimerase n=1 Tax=Rhizobium sp. SEMIA 4085 TaxID=2137761 RepID=UPI0014787BAF